MMSYTAYQRLFALFSLITFSVMLIANWHAALVFLGGIILGLLIAITYKLADQAGEVKRR